MKPTDKIDSKVLECAAAIPQAARAHFSAKLSLETDPSDVHEDMKRGNFDFIVVDTRAPEAYARGHIPGAINLWHRQISPETVKNLSKSKLLVTYCTGVGCNGSTKGALKLAVLGFRVKEMIGGLECWTGEGYPVEMG